MFALGIATLLLVVLLLYKTRHVVAVLQTPEIEYVIAVVWWSLFCVCVFCTRDSPVLIILQHFRFHSQWPGVLLVVTIAAAVALGALRKLRRQELRRSFLPQPPQVANVDAETREITCALARHLAGLVDAMAQQTLPRRAIEAIWRPGRSRDTRAEVHRILVKSARRCELDFVILSVNVPQLLEYGSNDDTWKLLKMHEWKFVETKVALIHALQHVGRIRARKEQQEWAEQMITNTFGQELLLLKNLLDSGGNHHNLLKLVFQDITYSKYRDNILRHIQENSAVGVHDRIPSSVGSGVTPLLVDKRVGHGPLKVLSDLDDTLVCSGGHFPAGVDKRFPRRVVYPGIMPLYLELVLPSLEATPASKFGLEPQQYYSGLVFLSARPHLVKDVSEQVSYNMFQRLVKENVLHAMPTLIPGDLARSACAIFLHSFQHSLRRPMPWKPMGEAKYKSMKEYSDLYGESSLIFFGDNGQGDVVAAELALIPCGASSPIKAAFIFEVQAAEKATTTLGGTLEERKNKWLENNIFHVRSPLAAAYRAVEEGLLGAEALRKVASAACNELVAVVHVHHGRPLNAWARKDWERRVAEHNEDVEHAAKVFNGMRRKANDTAFPGKIDLEALTRELLADDLSEACSKDEKTQKDGNEAGLP